MDITLRTILGDWQEDGFSVQLGAAGIARAVRLSRAARLVYPMAQNPTVFACVRVNARSASTTPIELYETDEDDAPLAPRSDPLWDLLKRKANPLMSGRMLWASVCVYWQLCGGAYLFLNSATKVKGRSVIAPISKRGMPTEVWPVRDDLVEPVIDEETRLPKAYRYKSGSREVEYPAHAVAHLYEPDPDDPLRGFGPVQAIWRAADHLFRAEAFDDAIVENGGQIGGVYSHEDKRLKVEQLQALRAQIDENAKKPKNDRKNVVLPGGLKFTPATMTPVEMQARDMRLLKRDEIMAALGVPKTMLGYTDDVNRANAREVRRAYYEGTVGPYLEWLEDSIVAHLIPLLPPKYEGWTIGFPIEKTAVMRENLDSQVERIRKFMGCGLTFAEAARIVGLDHDVVDSNRRFLDATLVPIELAGRTDSGPAKPDSETGGSPDAGPAAAESPGIAAAPAQVVRSGRDRRLAALAAEEKRLSKHDQRFKRAVRRVFEDYVLAQTKKLREVASGAAAPVVLGARRRAAPSVAWRERALTESQTRFAEVLDLVPPSGGDGWVVGRGVTEDELEALVLGNEQKWGEELWGALVGPYKGAIDAAAAAMREVVGGAVVGSTDPRAIEFLARKEILVREGPMSVVAERVKRVLVEGLTSSSGDGSLVDRVREALESLEEELTALKEQLGTRAAMVARTESAAAANFGRLMQYAEAGVERHEWASAGDDLVRALHVIDGEVVRVGEKFSNGLRHPGDPEGDAGNVINCRCTTLPVVEGS